MFSFSLNIFISTVVHLYITNEHKDQFIRIRTEAYLATDISTNLWKLLYDILMWNGTASLKVLNAGGQCDCKSNSCAGV